MTTFMDASAVTDFSDLQPNGPISRYLSLVAEARKRAETPYSGLFMVIPPDPRTLMIKEFAIMYAVVGVLLFFVAVISGIQALLGSLNRNAGAFVSVSALKNEPRNP